MNEKRKATRDYMNGKLLTPEKAKADELAYAVKFLLQNKKLPSEILLALHNMLRQLEDTKTNLSKKVLRSMESKIGRISSEYGRGR